jgi:MFS family permease
MESRASAGSRPDTSRGDGTRFAYRHTVLGLCTAASFFYLAGRIIIPPLAVPIKEGMGIGNAEFGLALTLLWAAYALMQFPGGVTSDQLGHKTILVGGTLVSALGFALLSVGRTYGAFLLAAVVTGVGGGLYMIVQFRFLSVLYGPNKGRAFGISGGVTGIAGVLAPIGITTALGVVSWRLAFAWLVVVVLGVAVAFHLWVRERYVVRRPTVSRAVERSIDQIRSPRIVVLMAVTATFSVTVQAVTTFIPLYMFEVKGLSFELSGAMLSVYFLVAVVARPLSGLASDVLGRRILSSGALIASGVLLATVALFAESMLVIVVTFALFSAAIVSFSPSMDAYFMDLFEDDSMGGAFGLARTFILFVGSLGPFLFGLGTESIGFTDSFAVLSGAMFVAGLVLLSSDRVFGRSEARVR